jgi:glutaredoxin-like protein NrdH
LQSSELFDVWELAGETKFHEQIVVFAWWPIPNIRRQSNPTSRKDVPMSHPKVTIYSLSTCSHCRATKKFLGECTIKYEFIDVDKLEGDERKAIIADVKKFNPRCSFPTIIIGETVVVGYKEKELKEALGME